MSLVALIAISGCSTLLGTEATPVPGAAATLTRSINTPIPTPLRTPSAAPSASPGTARPAASPSALPGTADQTATDTEVAALQRRIEQAVASADLQGIDGLLLDHVALSTPKGGSVMDNVQTASWLRSHAGPSMRVTQFERSTQEAMLQVQTDGWPKDDPIERGQVTFGLRRYDANGRQDQSGGGEWKIDVIDAE